MHTSNYTHTPGNTLVTAQAGMQRGMLPNDMRLSDQEGIFVGLRNPLSKRGTLTPDPRVIFYLTRLVCAAACAYSAPHVSGSWRSLIVSPSLGDLALEILRTNLSALLKPGGNLVETPSGKSTVIRRIFHLAPHYAFSLHLICLYSSQNCSYSALS